MRHIRRPSFWKTFFLTIAALSLLGVQRGASQSKPAAAIPSKPVAQLNNTAELEAFLDGTMGAHMLAQEIPAAVVAVVKDGKLIFSKGYGYADREKRTPVDPARTLFRPGSISKLFTWTAVMQLQERGLLDLDADVNKYLKDFQIPSTYPQPITMKHLMTHTPGFEDGGLGFLFVRNEGKIVPLGKSLAAHIPMRVRPPGTYSSYSNFGTALAGLIVANLSGMAFEEYVEKNILIPLGMEHSTFREPLPPTIAGDMAVGYKDDGGVYKKEGFEFVANFAPAGALSASAEDMARFMIAHLQNGRFGEARILQEATAQKMHSQIYTLDPRLPGMAYGFYETKLNGQHIIGHGGDTQWFHSNLALLPEHNVGIYVSYVTHGGRARMELLKGFLDRYFPGTADQSSTEPADSKERNKRFAGEFCTTRHNWSTLEKLTAVGGSASVSVTKENTIRVDGLSSRPAQFAQTGPLLFQQVDGWNTLAFKENDRGEITHMFLGALPFMPFYRVPWYERKSVSSLIVGLSVFLCLTSLVSAFYHRKSAGDATNGSRWAIRLAVTAALLTIGFLLSGIAVVSAAGDDLIYELPKGLTAVLVLPHVTSLLAVVLFILAFLSWTGRWWGLVRRIHYSLFSVAMLALTWFYSHWNILGFKY
ncbi:MAG: serine hydrolase [Acidobacteria bacterium]|nr:serine hydrolase [Acidobacteriota bacterium]